MSRKPIVSSLSMAFKRATTITDDVEQAKIEHRTNLKLLVDKYMDDVQEGKAEGIRNAKDLIEVIKADLLLMGEANERTETSNTIDEIRVQKVTQALEEDSPEMQKLMEHMLLAMNGANDGLDDRKAMNKPTAQVPEIITNEHDGGDDNDVQSE